METGCLEIVVKREANTLVKAMRIGAIVLTVCFCLLAIWKSFFFFLPAAACAVGFYYCWLESVVDYEYVYVDKELRIAKIQQKQRRKELAIYDLAKMEVLAPIGSHHLDEFRNKSTKVIDYSSGSDNNKPHRYVLILSDGTELILDLIGEYSEHFLEITRMLSPRKVFRN